MADPRDAVAASAALTRELARVARLHEARHADPSLAQALSRLGDWQARRLHNTYADLAADSRYATAVAFFQDDLYSGADEFLAAVAMRETRLHDAIVAGANDPFPDPTG